MSYEREFMVVDLVLRSDAPTCGVDAFTITVVKMERQIRKLFTHLVFQSDAFNEGSVEALRASLGAEKHFYFEGFERGVNALFRLTVADLIGNEYGWLRESVDDAIQYRNKIFHGQLTDRCLQREDLMEVVDGVRRWCKALATGAEREIGYDGFARNSFQKGRPGLANNYRVRLGSVEQYRQFLYDNVRRRR